MRIFLTALIIILATQVSSFDYTTVYFCGKTLERDSRTETHSAWMGHYYIHFSENENEVVILHNGYQFSTLETRKYDDLWGQNGALTILVIKEKTDNLMKFELRDLLNGWKNTLLVDFSDLTYVSRWSRYPNDPYFGVCEKAF